VYPRRDSPSRNTIGNSVATSIRDRCDMSIHGASRYADGRTERDRLLTINDVAFRLAISRDSVYRLVRSGALRSIRVGERLRFRLDDLEAYLARDAGP